MLKLLSSTTAASSSRFIRVQKICTMTRFGFVLAVVSDFFSAERNAAGKAFLRDGEANSEQ